MLSFLKMLFLGSAALFSCVYAQTEVIPFEHEKTYIFPSGKKVMVTFRERQCQSGECREVDAGMWGMDGGVPRFITETFIVFIDGNQFLIPGKFYKDLTNTYAVNVLEQNGRVIIELKGARQREPIPGI